MNARDLPEFTELMTGVCVLYGKAMSDALMELYWRALESFEFGIVKAAFEAHVGNPDTGQFMPKPADVVRYVEGSSQTRGLLAWSKVTQAIRSVGSYESIVFDDPLIHVIVEEMGGWIQLNMMLIKDMPFRGNEFEKRYVTYLQRPPSYYPPKLVGIHEAHNSLNGYPVKPPLLFGDRERALAVLQSSREKPIIVHVLTPELTQNALLSDSALEHSSDE